MPVITIRGQEASGAPEIGKMVAKELGIDYVDNEIISDVARRLHRHEIEVEKKEILPSTLLGRIARALSAGGDDIPRGYQSGGGAEIFYVPMEQYPWEIPLDDALYLQTLKTVITELAKSQAIIIRGRGSQFILKDFPGAFHVLVVAPFDLRVKRAMERLKLDEENAKKEIKRSDGNHREFIKRYFHTETEDPLDYDLVINTKRITIEEAVSIIVNSVPAQKKTKP
jgi:cytidylate kinase